MQHAIQQQLEEDLVAYLDGELPEARAAEVRAALAADPSLAEEARRLRQTWDLLDVPAVGVAREIDVTARVLARVGSEAERRTRRMLWIRRSVATILSAAAAILLAVFIGLLANGGAVDVPGEKYAEVDEIPADVERVLVENLDVIMDHVTLENLEMVRALEREGVFAAVDEPLSPR